MPPSVTVARGNLQPLTGHGRSWRRGRPALGELTELRVRDIDFPTRMLTVSRAVVEVNAKFHPAGGRFLIKDYPKDGEYRRLKLTSQIVAKLQAYICERGLSDGDLLLAMPERSPTLKDAVQPGPARPHRTQRRWPHLLARDAQRLHSRALPMRTLQRCFRPVPAAAPGGRDG